MEIIVRDWWWVEPDADNAYLEARQEYLDWIQETYNFKISRTKISEWGTQFDDYLEYTTSGGDSTNYIFVLRQAGELVSAINSDLMYDLSTLDCLDFSDSLWNDGVAQICTKGSSQYGMSKEPHEPSSGLYFNKRLLEEAGINPEDIYELQRTHQWTWAKFEEILEQLHKDTDSDGTIDKYALVGFSSDFYPYAIFSNGGFLIGKDANGYYNNLESENTLEALNWAMEVFNKYNKPAAEDQSWDYFTEEFKNGNAAFFCRGSAYMAEQQIGDMEDDYGFVAFPMGPKMSTYASGAGDNVFVIPACYDADRAWKIAFAYNLYLEPIPGYEDYSWYKNRFMNCFRDTTSVDETFDFMDETLFVEFVSYVPGPNTGSDLYWAINKDNTPAAQAEAIRNTWQAYIDEANGQ